MLSQRVERQQTSQSGRFLGTTGALQELHLAVGQLDRFGHEIAFEQNLDGEAVGADVARLGRQRSAAIREALRSQSLGHPIEQKAAKRRRIGQRFVVPVEENVGQWE